MAERTKAHVWKACGQQCLVGSNPTPSVHTGPCAPLLGKSARPVWLGEVAERQCTGLENRRPHGLVGSNPTLSVRRTSTSDAPGVLARPIALERDGRIAKRS